jgi:SAM-dependent methyltransferase
MEKKKPTEEEMWAGPSGQRWLSAAGGFEKTLRPIGEQVIDRAKLKPGVHVLEIGCGAGGMCLDMAARVVPGGSVTGLDISSELAAEGNRRAASAKVGSTVNFIAGDAGKTNLPRKYDRLVSRFGVMFFTDPYGAFAHLHAQLAPTATLAMATWAPVSQNIWMLEMRKIFAQHFELPVLPPRTPGPFAFDDPDYQRDILTRAGFKSIDIQLWQKTMSVGGPGADPETAAGFLMAGMSIAQKAVDAGEAKYRQIFAQLQKRLEDFNTPAGVQMPIGVYFTTAAA